MGYYDFLKLLDHSKKILTDSGGIQKEAYILKVPCVTLRENTEWVETISDGWNVLAGSDRNKIVDLAQNFNPSHTQSGVFGNGACKEIVRIIGSFPLTKRIKAINILMTTIDSHMHLNFNGLSLRRIINYLDREKIDICWLLSWEEIHPGPWHYQHLAVEDIYEGLFKISPANNPFLRTGPSSTGCFIEAGRVASKRYSGLWRTQSHAKLEFRTCTISPEDSQKAEDARCVPHGREYPRNTLL